MRCEKCGTELTAKERFCMVCGTPNPGYSGETVLEPDRQDNPEGVSVKNSASGKDTYRKQEYNEQKTIPDNHKFPGREKEGRQENRKKKVIIGLGAVAAAVVVCICIFALRRPVINLNDYAEPNVVVNGYNGYGEISVDFDYDGMYEDTVDIVKLPDVSDDDWYVSGEMAYSDGIYELIAGHFEPSENLSNGDEPVLIWDISPEYEEYFEDTFRCRIKYNEFTYSINGLEDIETVDPFKEGDFTLDFSGTAPDGMAMVSNNAHQEISYEVTPASGLSNGDTVTVTAELPYGIEDAGFALSETEKTFTVEGLEQYVDSLEQIPDDYLELMESQANDAMQSAVAEDWDTPDDYKGMEYIGSYLAVVKEGSSFLNNANELCMVFRVTAGSPEGEFQYYYYTTFSDLKLNADGSCSTDLMDYDVPYGSGALFSDDVRGAAFRKGGVVYVGYENLDLLYNQVIVQLVEDYTITDNLLE